jgi:hypothetical protein
MGGCGHHRCGDRSRRAERFDACRDVRTVLIGWLRLDRRRPRAVNRRRTGAARSR